MKTVKKWMFNLFVGLSVAIIVSLVSWGWKNIRETPKQAGIYEPVNEARVNHKVMVQGWYSEKEAHSDIWLVVQPVESSQYHPQPGPLPKDKDGQWRGIAYVGTPSRQNTGEAFLVYMVTAKPEASQNFAQYLQDSASRNEWSGLQNLPPGATSIDSIRVIRK